MSSRNSFERFGGGGSSNDEEEEKEKRQNDGGSSTSSGPIAEGPSGNTSSVGSSTPSNGGQGGGTGGSSDSDSPMTPSNAPIAEGPGGQTDPVGSSTDSGSGESSDTSQPTQSDDQIEATANELTGGELGDPIEDVARASQSRSFGTTGTPSASRGVVEPTEDEIRDRTPRANQSRSLGTTGTPSASRGLIEDTSTNNPQRSLIMGAANRYVDEAREEQRLAGSPDRDDINFSRIGIGGFTTADATEAVVETMFGVEGALETSRGQDPIESAIQDVGGDIADSGSQFARDNPAVPNPDSILGRGLNTAQQALFSFPGDTIEGSTEAIETGVFFASNSLQAYEPSPVAPGDIGVSEEQQAARDRIEQRERRIAGDIVDTAGAIQEDPAQAGRLFPAAAALVLGSPGAVRRFGGFDAPDATRSDAFSGAVRQTGDAAPDTPSNIASAAADLETDVRDFFGGVDRGQAGPGNLLSGPDGSSRTIGGDDIAGPSGRPSVGTDRTFEEGPTDSPPGDRPSSGQTRRDRQQLRESSGEGTAPPRAAAARMRAQRQQLAQDVDVLDDATQSDFFGSGALAGAGAAAATVGATDSAQTSGLGIDTQAFSLGRGRTGGAAGLLDIEGTGTGFGGRFDSRPRTNLGVGGATESRPLSFFDTPQDTRTPTVTDTPQDTDTRARPDPDPDPTPDPTRPRFPDFEDGNSQRSAPDRDDGRAVDGGRLLDGAVSSGFFRETVAAAAGVGAEGRAPAEGPVGDVASLTGEVATQAEESGSQATQDRIDRVAGVLSPGGGGEIDGGLGFDLGGGDDSDGFGLGFGDENSESGFSLL